MNQIYTYTYLLINFSSHKFWTWMRRMEWNILKQPGRHLSPAICHLSPLNLSPAQVASWQSTAAAIAAAIEQSTIPVRG